MRIAVPSLGKWLIGGTVLVVIGMLLLPAVQRIYWVGRTDLEIEYIVTDAGSRQPIKGATITIQSEGGLCAEKEKQQFVLVTDENGSVKRLSKSCMCFGTSGWNIDTFIVHLPWWFYQVAAEGYSPTEWTALDVSENDRRVQRSKPAAKLVVRIDLEKRGAEPAASHQPPLD